MRRGFRTGARRYVARIGRDLARLGKDLRGGTGRGRAAKRRAAPGGRETSKHRGDVAEMQFMIEAKNRGFGVSKPFGDNERYDLILDGGRRRLWRVQVKSSASVHHKWVCGAGLLED